MLYWKTKTPSAIEAANSSRVNARYGIQRKLFLDSIVTYAYTIPKKRDEANVVYGVGKHVAITTQQKKRTTTVYETIFRLNPRFSSRLHHCFAPT